MSRPALVFRLFAAALLAFSSTAKAQYCPVGSVFFPANLVAGCTVGTCWSNATFMGSNSISGTYPASYYACATTASGPGAPKSTLLTYDANGNVVSSRDAVGNTTGNTYDGFGRLKQITQSATPTNAVTQYSYEANGSVSRVIDPRGLQTDYVVNGFGETSTQSSPDTGTTITSYDVAGNLRSRVDARGVDSSLIYDEVNRPIQVSHSKSGTPTETVLMEYDGGPGGAPFAKGKMTKLTDSSGVTTWTYQSPGRIRQKSHTTGGVTLSVVFTFDSAGRMSGMTLPSGNHLTALQEIEWVNSGCFRAQAACM